MKKNLIKLLFTLLIFAFSNNSFAAISSPSMVVGENYNQNFSENSFGFGISTGIRFNIIESIFVDNENIDELGVNLEKKSPAKRQDHIFTEIEGFANQFASGEIENNYGARLNLGYEYYGFRIFASGGYLASSTAYQEEGGEKQNIKESSPFFGGGIAYDITKNIGIRVNSMFYSLDFTPNNSEFRNVKVDVSAISVGLGLHF